MKNNMATIGIFISIFLISICGCIQGDIIGNGNNMGNTTSGTNIKEFKVVPATPDALKKFLNSLEDNYATYGLYSGNRFGVSTPLSPTAETLMKDAVVSEGNTMSNEITVDRYSKTNVQVEGIDEGDILKTDGNYIYYSPEYPMTRYSSHSKYYFSERSTYIIDALPPESAKILSNISKGGILYLYNKYPVVNSVIWAKIVAIIAPTSPNIFIKIKSAIIFTIVPKIIEIAEYSGFPLRLNITPKYAKEFNSIIKALTLTKYDA